MTNLTACAFAAKPLNDLSVHVSILFKHVWTPIIWNCSTPAKTLLRIKTKAMVTCVQSSLCLKCLLRPLCYSEYGVNKVAGSGSQESNITHPDRRPNGARSCSRRRPRRRSQVRRRGQLPSEKGKLLLRGVGTLRYLFPPNASVQWQPDVLTIHTNKWFLGAGFLGAPPISLMRSESSGRRSGGLDALTTPAVEGAKRGWASLARRGALEVLGLGSLATSTWVLATVCGSDAVFCPCESRPAKATRTGVS